MRTFDLTGELPLLCSAPKDALYFFDLTPNATRIQWATGYAERPAGPGTRISLRVLLQAVIADDNNSGEVQLRIEDPWEGFCAKKAILPSRSLALRICDTWEGSLDDTSYATILTAQPHEIFLGNLWLAELGGLAAAISRRYPHGLPHPMLLIDHGCTRWSHHDVETIAKLGQLGIRFELHVLLHAARAVLADCSRAAPYIDRLFISRPFDISLTAVGGIRGRLHHPWNDIHDAWPPSQLEALPAISKSSSIRYLRSSSFTGLTSLIDMMGCHSQVALTLNGCRRLPMVCSQLAAGAASMILRSSPRRVVSLMRKNCVACASRGTSFDPRCSASSIIACLRRHSRSDGAR